VESDYGSPNPPVGENYLNYGMTITASVDSPVTGANEGTRYVCAGWTGTGSAPPTGDTNSCQFTLIKNSIINWVWNTQYYLTVDSPYGNPQGEGWYDEGGIATWSVTSPWPSDPGIRYVADRASGGAVMDAPKTVTVDWTIQYQLTTSVSPEGGGTITRLPEGDWYDADTVVQLTAVPNAGYEFTNWSGDLSGSDNPETLTMDGPKTVTANFAPLAIYVDGANGDDSNDGLSWETAVKTIQTGIDLAPERWTVLVANGTYTGDGNKNLDFGGKAIDLKSVGGAENCVIDCENSGRGFYFDHTGETADSIVDGFTIQNGDAGTE
jgi:hypothetical protein